MRPTASLLFGVLLSTGCYPAIDLLPDLGGKADGVTGDCEVWADGDGDGFGAGEALVVDCDALPAGTVDNADDCDDGDATVYPEAAERCDGVDNDCNGDIDDNIVTSWYIDGDGDGFGDPDSQVDSCDPPDGYISEGGDCDDSTAARSPDGVEICDELDNDCDEEVDEDAEDAATWYLDGDGDGYGVIDGAVSACVAPEGYSAENGDCDDNYPQINPGAAEVCNSLDDDCDGQVDDADPGLDPASASVFYTDADGDGFGDPDATVYACIQPTGAVLDATDCDDNAAEIRPGASEICDSLDNDCDGAVDDADSDLDLSTATVFYSDADGDGYGSATATVRACLQPSTAVTDSTDCNDASAAINPAASEVCDSLDNDCDGDVDDADSSLDLSTLSTWYRDADNDGLGDPATTATSCAQPTGYVSNSGDCDDDDATDTDSDGVQDCADSDIDGDGLRNVWDAAVYDATIRRGPTGGLGGDGAYSLSTAVEQGDWALASGALAANATSISVDDATPFSVGDEVLILSQQGTDAGRYQFVFVSANSGSTNVLTIEPALTQSYAAASTVLVQRVPHYTTATISGTLSASPWLGSGGGVVVFRATGAVVISGNIDVDGLGFQGGPSVRGNSSNTTQGESWNGSGTTSSAANQGGGGVYYSGRDYCSSGGGGGHGAAGSAGSTRYWYVSGPNGGGTYGSSSLGSWYLGSGGGGGSPDSESDGNSTSNITGAGGAGGGLVALYSATSITVSGEVGAEGEDGEDASSAGGEIGGGGGGSGGQVLLAAPLLTLGTERVRAEGGGGGDAEGIGLSCGNAGGDGGDGRIQLLYTTRTGTTSPTAATGSYVD